MQGRQQLVPVQQYLYRIFRRGKGLIRDHSLSHVGEAGRVVAAAGDDDEAFFARFAPGFTAFGFPGIGIGFDDIRNELLFHFFDAAPVDPVGPLGG